MARVTVEDCLEQLDNKFELAAVAAKRARQLARGADARLDWEGDKPTVMALREVAEGAVGLGILQEADLPPAPTGMEMPTPPPEEAEDVAEAGLAGAADRERPKGDH